MHGLHAAETGAGDGRAMVCVDTRDDRLSAGLPEQLPVLPDHANHRVDRLRSGPCIKDPVELRLRNLDQHPRQFD
jgi:hypothetical protein